MDSTYFLVVILCGPRLSSWAPVRRTPSALPKEDILAYFANASYFSGYMVRFARSIAPLVEESPSPPVNKPPLSNISYDWTGSGDIYCSSVLIG